MTVSLDRIVNVAVTRATRVAARRDFGKILIAAYHTVFPELARLYTEPEEMITDGFDALDPAYIEAVAIASQPGRPRTFKVGRRAGVPTQGIQLTPSLPAEGEIFSITIGGVTFSITSALGDVVLDVTADLFALMTADDIAVATALASAAAAQVFTSADFDGTLGGTFAPPRNVTATFDANADWLASNLVITGKDTDGRVAVEVLAVPVGGGATVVGTTVFSEITQADLETQAGAGGVLTLGVGVAFANANLTITPTDNATDITIVAAVAGDWYAYSDATGNLAIVDQTADPTIGIAADLAAMRAFDADWYGLVIADAQSSAQIQAAAGYADTVEILYCAHTMDSDCEDSVSTDILSELRNAARYRTIGFYSRGNAGRGPAGALMGQVLGIDPGAWSPAFKTLAGLTADEIRSSGVDLIIGSPESPVSGKGGVIYVEVRPDGTNIGTAVTMGGLTGGAEWMDVVQGIDFSTALIQERAWNILLNAPKVGFTAAGIDLLVGAVRGALLTVSSPPFGVFNPAFTVVEGTALEDVAPSDRQNRSYDGARYDARVQGAIHATIVRGTVRP